MRIPITKEYLDELQQNLIESEEVGDRPTADLRRSLYRQACAAGYSSGKLVFKEDQ